MMTNNETLPSTALPIPIQNRDVPWFSLVWKEWTEHKGSILWITLLCLLGVLPADGNASAIAIATLISLGGALFLATSVLAGERDEGSWNFVNTLPIQRWKLGAVRMAVSCLLCLVPLLVSGIAVLFIRPVFTGEPAGEGTGLLVFLSCGLCLSHYLWITATAYGQPTQIRVGVLGIIVTTFWFSIDTALGTLRNNHGSTWVEKLGWLGPSGWGSYATVPPTEPSFLFLLCQLMVLGLLFLVSVLGYGVSPHRSEKSFRQNPAVSSLPPHRSPNAAIAWLQIRESLPLCGAGAAMLLTLSFVAIILFAPAGNMIHLSSMVETTALVIGIPWVAITAVGTFVPNLTGGLHTFWRSRPIDISEWYWSKFWLGAAVSLGSIHLPVIVIIGITRKLAWEDPIASCIGYLLYPLIHLMVYSFGILAATAIRRLIQAGTLAIAVAILSIGMPVMPNSSLAFLKYDRARESITAFIASNLNPTHAAGFLPLLVFLIVMTGIAATLGSFFVRRDSSLSRR